MNLALHYYLHAVARGTEFVLFLYYQSLGWTVDRYTDLSMASPRLHGPRSLLLRIGGREHTSGGCTRENMCYLLRRRLRSERATVDFFCIALVDVRDICVFNSYLLYQTVSSLGDCYHRWLWRNSSNNGAYT